MDGIQYLTIAVGRGGVPGIYQAPRANQINPGTVYTFALGGDEKIPDFPKSAPRSLIDLPFEASTEELENGSQIYKSYCAKCHAGGIMPDLKTASPATFEIFHSIVGQGAFLGKGMPNFGNRLSEQDIQDVKRSILSEAKWYLNGEE